HHAPILLSGMLLALAAWHGGAVLVGQEGGMKPPREGVAGDRYLLHLGTDKPVYRPGETVYVRGALLEAFTRTPSKQPVYPEIKVLSPRGAAVVTSTGSIESGVLGWSWRIPRGQVGGEYKVVAESKQAGYPPAEAKFDVRSYRAPRLKTDLQFVRKAYGPGDDVTATLAVTRAQGGVPAGAPVKVVATVDGQRVHESAGKLGVAGGLVVTFKLPGKIATGDGTLAMIIDDGGGKETAAKTIPIVLNKITVSFYPAGGDLVAGLPSRIYVEARGPRGLPADVAGKIVDGSGRTVAAFRTEHEGRGRAELIAPAGEKLRAIVEEPAGIDDPFELPEVKPEGFALDSVGDVEAGERIRFKVASTSASRAAVVLSQREREVARVAVDLKAKEATEVAVTAPAAADGVLRATLMDEGDVPRAERLVFRRPQRKLAIEVTCDPARSVPAGKARVVVRCKDGDGKPARANVMLTVVDDAVLQSIDRRDRPPRLPVQVLLENEVQELADAQVYLAPGDEAARDVDLLLGTQGWRRFAFRDPTAFVDRHKDRARRVLALRRPEPPRPPMPMMAMPRGGARAARGFKADAEEPMEGLPDAGPAPDGEEAAGLDAQADEPVDAGAPAPEKAAAAPAMGRARADFFAPMRRELERARISVVREYAHKIRPGRRPGQRSDFAETLLWKPGLPTDEKGEATAEFDLSDSITTFRAMADGFSADGALGEGDATVESRKPFYVEAKLPYEVTAGDRIDVPLSLVNSTSEELETTLSPRVGNGLALGSMPIKGARLSADTRLRLDLPVSAGSHRGVASVRIRAAAGVHEDEVSRTIDVVPPGFPIELSFGGLLGKKAEHRIVVPATVEQAGLTAEAIVYPSPVASLTQAVAALLREPGGCFEQTSSSNYPNVLVLNYLKSHRVDDPGLIRRASELLDAGYKKLVGFECAQKGYEWFGQDPGHEALTAYGVMEFADMSQVYPVDRAMIARTRAWLMGRRDGKGGFLRNERALDSFGRAPREITDAYITWALLESGTKELDKELALLKERAQGATDPYLLALAGIVLAAVKDPAADAILETLSRKQRKDGCVPGAATSITGSSGEGLDIETTSLAILGWLRSSSFTAGCELASRWLMERCKSGRFGSTQSTIMALKALLAYDAARAHPKAPGTILLTLDGRVIDEVPFTAEQQGPIVCPRFADRLTPGDHKVELSMVGGSDMPYSVQVRYHAATPASATECKVAIATTLASAEVAEGEAVDLKVELTNRHKEGVPMTVAIVGVPGGLEPRPDQLKELVKSGLVDAVETRKREVILYRRGMAPQERRTLSLSLVAAIPGEYTGPASRAYLYYTDEHKHWVEGIRARVVARSSSPSR
ncbi:MAG: A-macroglobulin complement component, partial [Candidatus Riflebacteria bacterium]|nr:A-macroglobulin complement component [Candidatus Riflebacteria bacterium]